MPEPEDLQPRVADPDAHLAALPRAVDVDLHRRLGEGEVRGAEAHLGIVDLEKRPAELEQRPFEVAEMRGFVQHQALDLVEHRGVRLVGVRTEGAPRRDDADRRLAASMVRICTGEVWVRSTMRAPSVSALR
jgi:hypothetical protein